MPGIKKVLHKKAGKAGIRNQWNDIEVDKALLYKRKRRYQLLSLGKALAFQDEDYSTLVSAKIYFTDEPLLLEFPDVAGFIFQMRFKIRCGCVRIFNFESYEFHL